MRFRLRLEDALFVLFVFFLLCLVAFATGHRPVTVGTDTESYTFLYNEMLSGMDASHDFEFMYSFFSKVFVYFAFPAEVFFSFLSALSIFFLVVTIFNLNVFLGRPGGDAGILIFCFSFLFCSFFFYSAQLNVVRQGVSSCAVFCFYSFVFRRRYGFWLVFSAVFAIGFHSSAVVYILLIFGLFFSYGKIFLVILLLSFCYFLGLSSIFVKYLSVCSGFDFYGKIMEYGAGHDYRIGVRRDFMFFSLSLGLALDFFVRRFVFPSRAERYFSFVKLYWLLIVPFLLFGFGAYSDRLLFGAWLYFSLVIGVFFSSRFAFSTTARFSGLIFLLLLIFIYILIVQDAFKLSQSG